MELSKNIKLLIWSSTKSTLFYIGSDNQWYFNRGILKGNSVKSIYKQFPDDLVNYFKDLYEVVGMKDKLVLKQVVKEVGITNNNRMKLNLKKYLAVKK